MILYNIVKNINVIIKIAFIPVNVELFSSSILIFISMSGVVMSKTNGGAGADTGSCTLSIGI